MKRVIFILLICALLVYTRAWTLEDVTILKEEVGSKSQQTSSADIKDLIKRLEDEDEKAKKQLLDRIWQESVRPLVDEALREYEEEEADILLSDIDGNGTREIIASFSRGSIEGSIAVVDETLSTIQVIDVGTHPIVKTTDLFGEGKQALIIESGAGGHMGYMKWIEIYRWEQRKFTNVWLKNIMASFIRSSKILAKVQIVDLDQDGIREIVRIGYNRVWDAWDEWEWKGQLEEEQETRQAKVEIEIGNSEGGLEGASEIWPNFSKVPSGYRTVYIFKETYFWNKDFNRYIQYTARIIKDTTVGSVSIASGTVVGVLGSDFQEGFNPNSVDVVLPDGRIVSVDKGMTTSNFQK